MYFDKRHIISNLGNQFARVTYDLLHRRCHVEHDSQREKIQAAIASGQSIPATRSREEILSDFSQAQTAAHRAQRQLYESDRPLTTQLLGRIVDASRR